MERATFEGMFASTLFTLFVVPIGYTLPMTRMIDHAF